MSSATVASCYHEDAVAARVDTAFALGRLTPRGREAVRQWVLGDRGKNAAGVRLNQFRALHQMRKTLTRKILTPNPFL